MKKIIFIAVAVIIIIGGFQAVKFYQKNLRGIGPVIKPPPEGISEIININGAPLRLPKGFKIEIFAESLPGARVMKFDTFGNMWVSQTSEGQVSLLEIQDNKVIRHGPVFKDLKKPHGVAFDPKFPFSLLIAEENRIIRVPTYSEYDLQKIVDLPAGGGHFTRTIGFGPDDQLYVSVGSSCNVCNETDARRAKILSMMRDGKDIKEFARGLRNTVFFTWHPKTKEIWGTDMGRDLIGDDIPPDEINVIKESGNYGWPICYGKNIHDTDFDKNTYIRNPCDEPFEMPSYIDLQAHSAPLGLAFIPATSDFPKEYWHDLLVAYHGSWNRSEPTGYKVVRFKLDEDGKLEGEGIAHDFITGWLTNPKKAGPSDGVIINPAEAYGRPADIVIKDGAIYISDDKAGVIYKVTYTGE